MFLFLKISSTLSVRQFYFGSARLGSFTTFIVLSLILLNYTLCLLFFVACRPQALSLRCFCLWILKCTGSSCEVGSENWTRKLLRCQFIYSEISCLRAHSKLWWSSKSRLRLRQCELLRKEVPLKKRTSRLFWCPTRCWWSTWSKWEFLTVTARRSYSNLNS